MNFENLSAENQKLIKSFDTQYVIVENRRYNLYQCICEITNDEVICHVIASITGHEYNVKTHYSFEEFLDAVKNHKIYKGCFELDIRKS